MWFWLSFSGKDGFGSRGATIVESDSPEGALYRSHELGVNPGNCSVFMAQLTERAMEKKKEWVNRLIPPEELEAMVARGELQQACNLDDLADLNVEIRRNPIPPKSKMN